MAMSRVPVGWSKNPTHNKIDSGGFSNPNPRMNFQT
jgi:hypothetical protein